MTHLWEGVLDEKNERSQKLAFILFMLILAYAGVEVVKVSFRKGFGRKGVHKPRLALSVLAFLAIAGYCIGFYLEPRNIEDYLTLGTYSSFLYTAVFFGIFSIYLLIKGLKTSDEVIDQYYRGRSTWLGFLIDRGWSPAKVQDVAEPLTMLIIGAALLPVNILLGAPLMFCAVSYWLHFGLEWFLGRGELSSKLSNEGHDYSRKGSFSKVIN